MKGPYTYVFHKSKLKQDRLSLMPPGIDKRRKRSKVREIGIIDF